MKIAFLAENKTDHPGINAEHGLSIYIESEGRKILFDTGASELFAKNAEKMRIDLSAADCLILSHGHYDHTEGVPYFCEINDHAKVYLHKDAFIQAFDRRADGTLVDETTGIRWNQRQKEIIGKRTIYTDHELWLNENMVISGTVHETEGFEPTEYFYEVVDGKQVADPMNHEQFLAIREEKGVYIFSGCSHRGVIPVLNHAKELFPGERIAGLIAGMHLFSSSDEARKAVVDQVLAEKMDLVIPVHCTGIKAICELKAAMDEKCIVATAGDIYEY